MTVVNPNQTNMERVEALILNYQPRLSAYIYLRTGSVDATEDILQETFLTVLRCINQLDPSQPAWPWLVRIAWNRFAWWHRIASWDGGA